MASFNRVMLIGNLTRDPQSKVLPSNTTVCEFGIAMNRRYRTAAGEDREEVVFIDCTAFGKPGEVIQQYCTKGKPLFVEGRLKLDEWEDKQGGGRRSKISVVVENFQFLGAPGGGDRQQHPQGDGDQRRQPVGPARRQAAQQPRGRQPMQYDERPQEEVPPF